MVYDINTQIKIVKMNNSLNKKLAVNDRVVLQWKKFPWHKKEELENKFCVITFNYYIRVI